MNNLIPKTEIDPGASTGHVKLSRIGIVEHIIACSSRASKSQPQTKALKIRLRTDADGYKISFIVTQSGKQIGEASSLEDAINIYNAV